MSDVIQQPLFLLLAYALALPVAWDREKASRSAGLRTFPMVAAGSCAFLLVGREYLPDTDSNARLMQGLLGGLGFLGGGAILKKDGAVQGMATAVSIWTTGAIGMAVAYENHGVAVALSVISFLTLWLGRRVKGVLERDEAGKGEVGSE